MRQRLSKDEFTEPLFPFPSLLAVLAIRLMESL